MHRSRAWIWILLGVAAFVLHLCLGRDSALVEKVYSRGLFVGLRWAWDFTLGLSPVPLLYIFLAAAAILLIIKAARRIFRPRRGPAPPLRTRVGRAALGAAGWAGGLVFFFYLLWGFNYDRIGVEKQLGLETPSLTASDFAAEAEWASKMATEARAAIQGSPSSPLAAGALPADLESHLRAEMSRALSRLGYPAPGRVRVRPFVPGSWMMRFSGTGIYMPFFGEGYAAANLLPYEKPFTLAHEMAHGFGFTDEGEASFLAFLACQESPLPAVRYSGYASYWSYAGGELARAAPSEFKALWAALPEGMKADFRESQKNWARFQGRLADVSRKVYDRYLKTQRISEGARNYSRVIDLVAAWKKKTGAA